MKLPTKWVASIEQARAFASSTPAINFCVENDLKSVQLYFSFENPKYDFVMDVFRAQTPGLIRENKALRERAQTLAREVDQIRAGQKERKKKIPFKRKRVAKTEPPDPAV